MTYVQTVILTPDGRRHSAEVALGAPPEELLREWVRRLGLGRGLYALIQVRDKLGTRGATLQIVRVPGPLIIAVARV